MSARAEKAALIALMAIALALRLTSVSRSLFSDEAYSLALSQRSFGQMIVLFGWEANGTLYSIVLWPLIRIFGDGEQLLRAPSVIAGVASVPAMWWAARQFAGREVALLAAALLAINPMAVSFGQTARAYEFVVLASCLAFGALGYALRRPQARGAWAGYVAAMAAMAYCDLLAAPLVVPAQLLLVWRAGPEARRKWLRALIVLALCCVPLLVAAVISRSRRDAFYWLPKTDRALVEFALQEFTGGFSGVSAVRWLTLAAAAVLVLGALWRLRGREQRGELATFAAVAVWGVLPAAALLVVSVAEPVFWPRYAIVALPGLCLLIALAAQRLWQSRAGALPAVGCVVAIAALGLFASVRQRHAVQEEWRPIATWLKAARKPGQPTIVDNALVLPVLGYYDPAFAAANGNLIVQEWRELPLPAGVVGYKDRTGYGSVPDGPPSAATFADLARRDGGTVWMIVAQVDDNLQANPRDGAAVAWARSHCHVEVRSSTAVWALRASGCAGSATSGA